MSINTVKKYTQQLGFETCIEIDADLLIPEDSIRVFCEQNKCGFYEKNHMCPPLVGSVAEFRNRLKKYRSGLLLQYTEAMPSRENLDMKGRYESITRSRLSFHCNLLKVEDFLLERGIRGLWGMIGGSCALCDTCAAIIQEPCRNPRQARMSLEATGVNVIDLLQRLGLEHKFFKEKITWTGCILCQDDSISHILRGKSSTGN